MNDEHKPALVAWKVWGHAIKIEAATYDEAVEQYRKLISRPKDGILTPYGAPPIEAALYQSVENVTELKRDRDYWKKMYEQNMEAREALDKIREAVEDTSLYDRDE